VIFNVIVVWSCKTVYINNIMTQPGETDGYTAYDHIEAILKHSCEGFVDYCIVNCGVADGEILGKYEADGAEMVERDIEKIKEASVEELTQVENITEKVAEEIYRFFRQS
jgi:2-phospho-L-lactate transferase/gluconeogenesis factor (CofD/UPF0052 family)